MMYKQEVTNFYNARTNYDNDATRNRAIALFDYTTLWSGQFILDIATGTGNIAIEAAKKVGANGSVIGVDIAAELLKIAHQNNHLNKNDSSGSNCEIRERPSNPKWGLIS